MTGPGAGATAGPAGPSARELPDFSLQHLRALTDSTGILQHARYTVPRRGHGYCTDDNARALLTCSMAGGLCGEETLRPLMATYLGFLEDALSPDNGRFRNFCSYQRHWLNEVESNDCHGRAVWALGHVTVAARDRGQKALAGELLAIATPACATLKSPRAVAFSVLGLEQQLRGGGGASGRALIEQLASYLMVRFATGSPEWPWPESELTYDNAVLCTALLRAGACLQDDAMVAEGLRSLDWLFSIQTATAGHLSPIGNNGWWTRGGVPARFCQQPLEASTMLHAALEAHASTGDARWRERAWRCIEWFLGRNDLGVALYDAESGGCFDGLTSTGVNRNQGAESTVAWLLALLRIRDKSCR